MVRNIVGSLVYIGKGKYPPEWVLEVLQSRERRLAAPTFSPDGLYLRRIDYDEKWGLPQEDCGMRIVGTNSFVQMNDRAE
jgi:tRNA pseudouridine38-40 synthase